MAKHSAEKRHMANSDTDSEKSYPASQPTKSSSSTSTTIKYVPSFNNPFRKRRSDYLFSFSVVHKTIMGIAGEPKSIKNLRSGDLLIQCAKSRTRQKSTDEDILWSKTLLTTHSSLNTSKVLFAVQP